MNQSPSMVFTHFTFTAVNNKEIVEKISKQTEIITAHRLLDILRSSH